MLKGLSLLSKGLFHLLKLEAVFASMVFFNSFDVWFQGKVSLGQITSYNSLLFELYLLKKHFDIFSSDVG